MRATALIVACLSLSLARAQEPLPMPPVLPPDGPVMYAPAVSAAPPAGKFAVPHVVCEGCNAAAAPKAHGPVLRCLNKTLHPKFIYAPEYQISGADKPVGCGNLRTDVTFIFGSCKSFFGTGISAAGGYHNTVVP